MAGNTKTSGRLARVYAEALMANAVKAGQADAVGAELEELCRVIFSQGNVANYVATPVVSWRSKEPVLAQALGGRVSDLVRNFVGVLNKNGRLGMIGEIHAAYLRLLDDAAGRVKVTVKSAVPLGPDQQSALTNTLASALKKQPILNLQVDPDLLGGVVVQVGDRIIDTSVRTRIQALRTQLMERGASYVLQN
jgi:F-type H+-transporting ATPase subunit delta